MAIASGSTSWIRSMDVPMRAIQRFARKKPDTCGSSIRLQTGSTSVKMLNL